jgi:hypothetical protein
MFWSVLAMAWSSCKLNGRVFGVHDEVTSHVNQHGITSSVTQGEDQHFVVVNDLKTIVGRGLTIEHLERKLLTSELVTTDNSIFPKVRKQWVINDPDSELQGWEWWQKRITNSLNGVR